MTSAGSIGTLCTLISNCFNACFLLLDHGGAQGPAVSSREHTLGVEGLDWKDRQVPLLLPPPLDGLDFSSIHLSCTRSPVLAGLTQNLQMLLLAAGPSCVATFTDVCPLLG